MAAQSDGTPQNGHNPTWVWVPGEVVHDDVSLTIDPSVTPGQYTFYVGFYEPESGIRHVVVDNQGQPQPENWIALEEIEVR